MIHRLIHQTVFITFILFCLASVAIAGNIDVNNDGHKYAWGENIGWINFNPGYGPGVTVTSTQLTGYAWGENIGWINMNPVYGGVFHDGVGNLSGYAWGENIGWISFSCENNPDPDFCTEGVNYGVHIDPQTGILSGKAWAENAGWIVFDYSTSNSYGVKAFWGSCAGNYDTDGDIDGLDLHAFATDYANGHVTNDDFWVFVDNFGLVDCNSYGTTSQQSASASTSTLPIDSQNLLSTNTISTNISKASSNSFLTTNSSNFQTNEASLSEESILETLTIEEVSWNNSAGNEGYATGEIEWQIENFSFNIGNTILNVTATDSVGFSAQKEIEINYQEIISENVSGLPEKWNRHFLYEFNFNEDYLQDTTFNIVCLTLFFWPDKITIIDDYTGSYVIVKNVDIEENLVEYKWKFEGNQDTKNILYLDIPFELIETN
ncbi:MAG: hypothetical protein KKE62_14585 [Proteobacteria bacterium]|nr:hypothetical protein [Pseudomonadota bacterium]MBU1389238.1 hypothetical protein [Pseudomonadota bacterium]MBU1544058.1 hypothetical protein [Pseudomonadota bacterium]MBU2482044.1 hypothetical protein [Pseudomonadota bacterium]